MCIYIRIFISCVLVFQKSRDQPDCFQQPDTYIIVGSMRHAAGLVLWICAAGATVDLVLFCRFFLNSDARLQTWTGLSGFLCFVPVISQPPRRVRRSCCWAKARDGILWIPVQIDPSDSKQCWLVNPETPETQGFVIFFPVFFSPVFLYSRYAIQRCLLLMPSSLLAFFQKTLAGRTGEPIWLSNLQNPNIRKIPWVCLQEFLEASKRPLRTCVRVNVLKGDAQSVSHSIWK